MGGCHATNLYYQILSNFSVDIIVRYEGEFTFLELVKAIQNNSELENIEGIAFKKGKRIVMLLRVDTSTKYFLRLVEANAKIMFIHKRLKYRTGKAANFPSMLVFLDNEETLK